MNLWRSNAIRRWLTGDSDYIVFRQGTVPTWFDGRRVHLFVLEDS